jgi:hypothetical protein
MRQLSRVQSGASLSRDQERGSERAPDSSPSAGSRDRHVFVAMLAYYVDLLHPRLQMH